MKSGLRNTSTLSAEDLSQIGLVVSEIWQVKVKTWGAFIQAGAFIWQNTVGSSVLWQSMS